MSVRALSSLVTGFAPALILATWLAATPALGQETGDAVNPVDWNGTWVAEGTLFAVKLTVVGTTVKVEEVQSLGQVWSAEPGWISQGTAVIPVSYMGAKANVLARLTGEGVGVAQAAGCMPEFMMVCTLSSGRQAVFRRQPDADPSPAPGQ